MSAPPSDPVTRSGSQSTIGQRAVSTVPTSSVGPSISGLPDYTHLTALPTIEDPRTAANYRMRGTQNCLRLDTKLQMMELEMKEFLEAQLRAAIEAEPQVVARSKVAKRRGEEMNAMDQRNCDRQQILLDELMASIRQCQEASARFVDAYLTNEELQRYADV